MNIKVGDLVMVRMTQPCCGDPAGSGMVYTVCAVLPAPLTQCAMCGRIVNYPIAYNADEPDGGFPVSRLFKIDPPPLTEDTPTGEELAT